MADNFLEDHYEKYLAKKVCWEQKKKAELYRAKALKIKNLKEKE